MKTETQQQIDKLQADLDRLKEIVSNSDEPKEGEWWYADCNDIKDYLVLFDKKSEHYKAKAYFTPSCESLIICSGGFDYLTRKATDQEVLTAFTNYFRSNGFVSGKSNFKSAASGLAYTYKEPLHIDGRGNIWDVFNTCIFDKLKLTLATLIEDEKIMVGENEVVFENGWALINGNLFDDSEIKSLLPLNPIFQKILDRLDK